MFPMLCVKLCLVLGQSVRTAFGFKPWVEVLTLV